VGARGRAVDTATPSPRPPAAASPTSDSSPCRPGGHIVIAFCIVAVEPASSLDPHAAPNISARPRAARLSRSGCYCSVRVWRSECGPRMTDEKAMVEAKTRALIADPTASSRTRQPPQRASRKAWHQRQLCRDLHVFMGAEGYKECGTQLL
jgi:hypothetical protein